MGKYWSKDMPKISVDVKADSRNELRVEQTTRLKQIVSKEK